jgi:hypothetical protein
MWSVCAPPPPFFGGGAVIVCDVHHTDTSACADGLADPKEETLEFPENVSAERFTPTFRHRSLAVYGRIRVLLVLMYNGLVIPR